MSILEVQVKVAPEKIKQSKSGFKNNGLRKKLFYSASAGIIIRGIFSIFYLTFCVPLNVLYSNEKLRLKYKVILPKFFVLPLKFNTPRYISFDF